MSRTRLSHGAARLVVAGGLVVALVGGASYLAVANDVDLLTAAASQLGVTDAASEDTGEAAVEDPAADVAPGIECDPHYPGLCLPPVSTSGPLECEDLMAEAFRVIPPDPHHLDKDNDGIGCEQD